MQSWSWNVSTISIFMSLFEHIRFDPSARSVQIYWADLRIEANLTGLRFYMVHWPLSTAILGISVFFALYALITICSIDRSTIGDDDVIINEIHSGSFMSVTEGQRSLLDSRLTGDVDTSILSPDSTNPFLDVSSSEADSTTNTI